MNMKEFDIHGARLSRRRFIGTSGALLAAVVLDLHMAAAQTTKRNSLDASSPLSWIEVHADNSIAIRTGKCDFGQSSIFTAYRQIVAEELCVPLEAITTVISGDTDRTPDGGGTFGLLRTNVLNLRKVAAYTREAVLALAAEKFAVPRAQVTVVEGVISGGSSRASYSDIITGQELVLEIPVRGSALDFGGLVVMGEPPLKDPADYTIVGQAVMNPIIRPKVSGEALWVGDVKLPGMLHARVIHPATLGSTLVQAGSVDKALYPGSDVVVVGNLLAVVSSNEWEAVQAARSVAATTVWSEWQGLPSSAGLETYLREEVDWSEIAPTSSRASKGDVDTAASKVHSGSYFFPFHKHAPIGPTVSLAEINDGVVTVHTHSQNPQYLRMLIARMLEVDDQNVVVRTYPGPGHFGRSNGGNAGSEDEAVLLARALGVPVRVQWMRDDDMRWSTQSSAMLSDIRIGLDSNGRIVSYKAVHSGPPMQDDRPIGAILAGLPTIQAPAPDNPFPLHSTTMSISDTWVYQGIENVSETGRGTYQIGQRQSPLAVGLRDHSMRTPIQFQQNFPRETAMNEAAALAGKDALEFRLEHVTDPRFTAILLRLREEAGWETRPSPTTAVASAAEGSLLRGRGLSIMLRDNGYWACAAHIAVDPQSGEVKVERITLVCDTSIVVNPLQLRRQAQAGCLMGVSQALHEEVSFDESGITSTNWMSYRILTMAEMPELKVVLAPDKNAKVYGQGSESANALSASAIAGAFLDATGKPIRRIPLKPEYVKSALA